MKRCRLGGEAAEEEAAAEWHWHCVVERESVVWVLEKRNETNSD